MQFGAGVRRAIWVNFVLSIWSGTAAAACAVHLWDGHFTPSQAEFTRQFIQGALPAARDVTLVRVADLYEGVRHVGHSEYEAAAFADAVDRALRTPVVRDAEPDSALGRAARRLALSAREPRALAACLVHQRCSDEVLFMFAGREAMVSAKTANKPGQPTFTELIYRNLPEAPTPYGWLLIEPARYASPELAAHLRQSLLSAMATYEVLLTLHDWAVARVGPLKAKRSNGLLSYLSLDRQNRVQIDEGLAHLLMFAQGTAVHLAMTTDPADAARRGRDLMANVAHHPKARRLARRLGVDGSADDLITWSERTMRRLGDEL